MSAAYGSAGPGWFPDPYRVADLRWWDGWQWTYYTAPFARPVAARPSNRYGIKVLGALGIVLGLFATLLLIGSMTGAVTPAAVAGAWRPDAAGVVAPNPSIDAVLASTVEVDSDISDSWYYTGAAVAISETEFLTAQHVVEGARRIVVIDADGNELTAVVTRQDAQRDLAVLETEPHGLPVATIAADKPKPGESAYAIGGSDWFKPITTGVVTMVRDMCRDGVQDVMTSAAIDQGDSGGPLVDGSGQVIGITTAEFDGGDGAATSPAEIRDFLALPDSAFDSEGYLVRPEDRDRGYCRFDD